MNVIDIAILFLLVAFMVKGLFRGLFKELCSLAGLIAGGVLAFRFHTPLAEELAGVFGLSLKAAVVCAFLLLFLTTVLFFGVLGFLLSRFVKLLFLGGLNRVAGGFFGLFQGVLLLTLTLFALSTEALPASLQPMFEASVLRPPFVQLAESVFEASRRFFLGSP